MLPLELQRLIWQFATIVLARNDRRTIYIAPDLQSTYDPDTDSGSWIFPPGHEDGRLLALPEPYPIPSLLAVCQESRTAALQEYTTWEIADPTTFSPTQKRVYINMACDTISFPPSSNWGDFAVLGMLGIDFWGDMDRAAIRDLVYYEESALEKYVKQLEGLQSLEMTFGQWDAFFSHNGALRWLRKFPDMRTLSVVLEYLSQETLDRTLGHEKTRSGPGRDEDEARVRWLFRNYLSLVHAEFPEQRIPQVRVARIDVSALGGGVSSILREISNAMLVGEVRFGKYQTS